MAEELKLKHPWLVAVWPARDRAKAIELKQELDRLGVFKDYEDRFLDLFKKAK